MELTNFQKANKLFIDNKLEESIEYYKKSIKENNQFCINYENIALAYKKLKILDESDFYIRKALSCNPNLIRSNYELEQTNKQNLEKKAKPLLSIIVPVHNTGKYLEKCISSILNQTLKELELIIIDDGSSDNSLDIINEFINNDSRIVLIKNKNASGNPGTPRNQAIKIANGYYLGFVDSDDWIDENMYKTLVDTAIENNNDMVFSGGFKNHVEDEVDKRVYNSKFFNEKNSKYFKFHDSFMIWDKIYRTDLIKKFNIELAETKAAVDVPFILKSYYYLHNVGFCDSLLSYNYRRESDTSVTINFRKNSSCDFELDAYQNILTWAYNNNVNDDYLNLIKIRMIGSYAYTLRVITTEMFSQFYFKAKKEIQKIDRNIVKNFSNYTDKKNILKNYDEILNLNSEEYQVQNRKKVKKSSFMLDGKNKGILFFPDWSKFNPYQKLFYGTLNRKYNIRIKGYLPEFFNAEVINSNKDEYKFIHLQWLHSLMDISIDTGADEILKNIKYAKTLGYKFIYTAHNIISHDSPYLERELEFRKKITNEFDYILVHGEFAKKKIINDIGVDTSKVYIIEHGVYKNYYLNEVSKKDARKYFKLTDDNFVFLFIGNIKGYKGVEPLLKSFKEVSKKYAEAKLIIAGKVIDKDSKLVIEEAVRINNNIIYKPGFVEEEDIQTYFNASDIMILPYKKILTSGASLLGISFDKPIIAPNTGLIPELISSKQGYLFDSFQEMTVIMNSCLDNFINNKWEKISKSFTFEKINKELDWNRILNKKPFSDIFKTNNEIGLYRILGNSIPLLHMPEQAMINLKKILEDESDFNNVDKYFILNRILCKENKKEIINYLESKDIKFLDIIFDHKVFKSIGYDFNNLPSHDYWFSSKSDWANNTMIQAVIESKNRYLMNNNGARNFVLNHGKSKYTWTMPWDGNCFLSDLQYSELENKFKNINSNKYIVTPMERALSNNLVYSNSKVNNAIEEPQISFRSDSNELFSENRVYGNQSKVELFKRLGFQGIWDNWKLLFPWKKLEIEKAQEAGLFEISSSVFRLFSGNSKAATDMDNRATIRANGILNYINYVESVTIKENVTKKTFKKNLLLSLQKLISDSKLLNLYNKLILLDMDINPKSSIVLNDISLICKTTKDTRIRINSAILLMIYDLNANDNVLLNKDMFSSLDLEQEIIYEKLNLKDVQVFKNMLSKTLLKMLFKLTNNELVDAVEIKLELAMLLYFHDSNKDDLSFSNDKVLKVVTEVIIALFTNIFEYDFEENILKQ